MKLRENFVRLINFFKPGLNSFRLYAEREAHAFQHAETQYGTLKQKSHFDGQDGTFLRG